MRKTSRTHSALLKSWLEKIENPADFTIDGKLLYCQSCSKSYDWHLYSQLTAHLKSALHGRNSERYRKKPELQQLINAPPTENANPFAIDLCNAMLAADMPWKKLNNPTLRHFLEKYTKKSIPEESTIRKNYLPKVYSDALDSIRQEIGKSAIYLAVDETADACGRYIANVLVGALKKDNPSPPYLLAVKQLEKTNNTIITQLILDMFPLPWPGVKQDEIGNKFCLLLTDGVPNMVKAGKNLKSLYPGLIHVTCVVYALNLVAEKVRDCFPKVDKFVGAVKAVFRKSPSRVQQYKEMCPNLPLPPNPVLIRWGTWLEAVEFYAQNFDSVKIVIDSLDKSEAKCIETSQQLFSDAILRSNLAYISANFCFVSGRIQASQAQLLSLVRSLDILEQVRVKLVSVDGEIVGEIVLRKFNAVIDKNEGLKDMKRIANILSGKDDTTRISPSLVSCMKFAPLSTVEVEKSFSIEKAVLPDRRRNFIVENVEKVLVSHHFLSK